MNAPPPASVVIVEDDPRFMQRFREIVEFAPSLVLSGIATTGAAAIALIEAQPADVYLVDLGLPDMDGIEVIRHAARRHPQADVMVITVFGDDQHVVNSIEAGATGYLLKEAMPGELIDCIHELRAGGSPISPVIARRLLQRFRAPGALAAGAAPFGADRTTMAPSASAASAASAPSHAVGSTRLARPGSPAGGPGAHAAGGSGDGPLSAREAEILRLIAKGLSFAEIGTVVSISPHTVTAHVKNIYRKLAVHSRGEAVFEAQQMGLVRF